MNDRHLTSAGSSHTSGVLRMSILRCAAAAAFAVAGCLGAGAALAANASLEVLVTPKPGTVSVGQDNLATYAAYEVTLRNLNNNVNNNVVFHGSSQVINLVSGTPNADYKESIPASACSAGDPTQPPGSTTFNCNFGQLQGNQVVSFVVLFKAPDAGAAQYQVPGSQIQFNWKVTYSNGSQSSTQTPSSPFCTGSTAPGQCEGSAATDLNTSDTVAFKQKMDTYIPAAGGTFFTGKGKLAKWDADSGVPACSPTGSCVAQSSAGPGAGITDPSTVTGLIRIPNAETLTEAHIAHDPPVTGGQTNDTLTTLSTTLTVPSSLPFNTAVLIELRRDASTVRSSSGINRAPVFYTAGAGEPFPFNDQLLDCKDVPPVGSEPGSQPNSLNPVCIFSRTAFTRTTAPAAEDIGDWRYVIKALENGGFKF